MNKFNKQISDEVIRDRVGAATACSPNKKQRGNSQCDVPSRKTKKQRHSRKNVLKKRSVEQHNVRRKKEEYLQGQDFLSPVSYSELAPIIAKFENNKSRIFSVEDLSEIFEGIDLESQSGYSEILEKSDEIFNFISTLKETLQNVMPGLDSLCSHMEDLFLTVYLMCKAQDISQLFAISALYLKRFVKDSLILSVINAWKTIDINLSHVREIEPQSNFPQFVDFVSSWRRFTQLDLFKEIGRIITILVTVGLFPQTVANIESYKIFDSRLFTKQLATYDLVECILSTMDYVVQCSYRFYKGVGFDFLCQSSNDLDSLEMKILHLKTYINSVVQGSYTIQTGKELSYFQNMLIETRNNLVSLVKVSKGDRTLYAILQKKLEIIVQIEVAFENARCFTSQREAPYCINIFGGSSRGKSSLSQILSVCILKHNGYDHDDTNFSTIQSDDKFYSTYRADTTCVILDDVANTVTDKAQVNPADRIIMIKNNVSYFAPKAEASEKGKIPVQPRLLTITTNVKDINASDWSQEPVSVLRRFDCIITAKVRSQFSTNGLLDHTKVSEWALRYEGDDPFNVMESVPDLWLLTVEKISVVKSPLDLGKDGFRYDVVSYKDKKMLDTDIYSVIGFLIHDSHNFYASQRSLMLKTKKLGDKIDFCASCNDISFRCACAKKCEEQSAIHLSYERPKKTFLDRFCEFLIVLHTMRRTIILAYINFWILFACAFYGGRDGVAIYLRSFVVSYTIFNIIYLRDQYCKTSLFIATASLSSYYDEAMAMFKSKYFVRCGFSIGAVCIFVASVRSLYKAFRKTREAHGNLSPTPHEIENRDKEANVWGSVISQKLPVNEATLTMTAKHLCNKIESNCVHVFSATEDSVLKTSALFIASNIIMIPKHYVDRLFSESNEAITLQVVRAPVVNTGSVFKERITLKDVYYIPETDLCLLRVLKGGVFNNIVPLYANTPCYGSSRVVYMDEFGVHQQIGSYCSTGRCSYSANGTTVEYPGGKCTYEINTFKGLCMAVHVTNTKNPRILGHHIAGYTGTREGRFCYISQDVLKESLANFVKNSKLLDCHSGGVFSTSRFGVDIGFHKEIYEKAPVNFLDKCPFKVYGTVGTQSTYFSEVKTSRMSKDVEEIMGKPNLWGKPQFVPRWKPWYDSLYHMSNLAGELPTELLEVSFRNYISLLSKRMETYKHCDIVRPLEDFEIINGIHGKRFIDSFNHNSGIGFPLVGTKGSYLEGMPGFKDWTQEKKAMLFSELDKAKECYLNGQRYYPIFKACLKDEPTLLTKDKVRVFMASDFVLQFMWRKYGLPLLRFMSVYPLDSEIAVGINCYSDEWQQMIDHVTTNGAHSHRIVAGDYSKWDLRLPIKVVLYALSVMVTLAEQTGHYSEDDLTILRGISTDTAYFVTHYNGTLMEVCGGMASGHNVTAHLNSICNALLLRSYFYTLHPYDCDFREYIKAIFYGDDFITGVSPSSNFNFIGYKTFLESIDMVLTMPNKVDDPIPYLELENTDFLKRKSVYSPSMGFSIGALCQESMYKSLHCHGKLKCTTDEHDIGVLSSFLMEAFAHGEDFYEESRSQVGIIASRYELVFPSLYLTYLEMGVKIRGEEIPNETGSDDYSCPGGASDASNKKPTNQDIVEGWEDMSEILRLEHNSLTNNTREKVPVLQTEARDLPENHMGGLLEAQSGADQANENSHTETGVSNITNATETMVTSEAILEQDILTLRQDDSRSLEYYMSRPYKILNREVIGMNYTFSNVLLQFLSSPRIRDKIRGYAYLNGTLHIKVMVNAPLRSSGALIVSLSPWHRRDNGIGPASNDPTPVLDFCQMSQLPHVLVDLSTECGGEISLPIITPTNGLDITDSDQIRDAMMLLIAPLVAPQVDVGDSNAKPFINIIAWMTNVSLTGTTTVSELPTAQSDEYDIPPQKQPSTIKAALNKIYAKGKMVLTGFATDLATAAIYSLMGLSKPFNLDPVVQCVRRFTGPMANFNGHESIPRLTGDQKQEVLVDSKYLGYDQGDEMDLMYVAKKKAIVSINGFQTDLPPNTDFYKIAVSPCCSFPGFLGASTAECFTPSPVAMCTLPFSRWRGGLKYTFQAIGSSFMRGKIKIAHDCIGIADTTTYDPFDFQILNHVVWDLSQSRKICVHVPWTSNLPFKDVPFLHRTVVLGNAVTPATLAQRNGTLIFNNITPIVDPVGNNISIITWVEAADDFVWSDPRPVLGNYTFAGLVAVQPAAQSGEVPRDDGFFRYLELSSKIAETREVVTPSEFGEYLQLNAQYGGNLSLKSIGDMPGPEVPEAQSFLSGKTDGTLMSGNVQDTCVEVNIAGLDASSYDDDIMLALCAGEKYTSIRQIIKRYTQNFTRTFTTLNNVGVKQLTIPDRPIMKGWQGVNSINVDPSGNPVTYARDSFLSYFSTCYLGFRGGFNHKVVLHAQRTGGGSRLNSFTIARTSGGYFDGVRQFSAQNGTNINAAASDITRCADVRAGGLITTASEPGMSVLEYNTPYNSNGKFLFAQNRFPQSVIISSDGGTENTWHTISVQYSSTNIMTIDKFTCAADDFTLFFFKYTPRMRFSSPEAWAT